MLKTATTVFLNRIFTCVPLIGRMLGIGSGAKPATVAGTGFP